MIANTARYRSPFLLQSSPKSGASWRRKIPTILTRTTYIREHRFNTRAHKNRETKPESEVAIMEVPPLIDRETFDLVQARLKSRHPSLVPARVTGGPTLLTGICFCSTCGGGMTLRTGRGSAGGEYRYYTCSTKARQGATGCAGRTIPMAKLDDLVANHLDERRSPTTKFASWDRNQNCYERSWPLPAGKRRRSALVVLY